MDIYGYAGKTLYVDLTSGNIRKEPLDSAFIDRFIGGIGAGARLAYDLIDPGVDPLSAESTFIIATGLYTGTNVPGSSKVPMVTKFPTTGIIEAGNAGSSLGPNLKWAGYDILIVTGKSEKPVYLFIDDDHVSIRDAEGLWGRDTYETTDTLWDRHGEGVSVLTTGQAGENQVKISIALVDKMNTLGKGGLGAMMGYKKLKAIALRGTKGFRVKDPETFNRVAMELTEKMKNDPDHDRHIKLGRMSRYENWAYALGWPYHNVRMTAPKSITDLFRPERYVREVLGERMACPSCVTGCKDHVHVREGVHKGVSPHLSSLYGRIMNWGSRCEVGGYDNAMKCQDLCNRSGLCVHSFTSLMDWAVDLYEHGVITTADTDGIELKRGFDPTVALMEKTVNREGFGKILAEGWLGAFEAIGRDCDKYAIHVKGVEPLFDPRLHRLGTVEFYEITNPRGGWGSRGRSASYIQKDRPIEEFVAWCKRTGVSEEARKRIFAQKGKFNVGRLTRYAEDWCYLADTLGGPCMEGRVRNYFSMDVHEELYRAATGWDKPKEDIKEAGERAFVMIKVLNARMGFDRKDDRAPERWFEPIFKDGKEQVFEDYYGNPMTREKVERLLEDYYDERGYNVDKGLPSRSKLIELGLEDVADGFD